jgi:peptidoglycan/LPS O-acetylase OafA/YrhL
LYMYHFMLIPLMLFFVRQLVGDNNSLVFNLFLYGSVIASTIGVASLSYYLVEIKFVKLKEKFSVVKSGTV